MILGLSSLSIQGLWVLLDEQAQRLLAFEAWEDMESRGLSTQIGQRFETLLARANISPQNITALYGVSGPGAFTGLRMGAAFLQGLARSLNVPLRAVPTFDLLNEEFFIPLRPHKTKPLNLAEAIEQKWEFLKLQGPHEQSREFPTMGAKVWGLRDSYLWPSPEQLHRGIQKNLRHPEKFKVVYGSEPTVLSAAAQKEQKK